uniref:DUF1992 domain-containing protein n=1 Tax=Desulfatirhabdium butyrativorans TaxID=340467 RepID=A0A7C4RTH7_9BACT
MITGFEKIVEERILAAQRNGEFDHLPGRGKPLEFEEDGHIPEDLRLAHKILKNADCLPPELSLKQEIRQTQELLSGMQDTQEKYRLLKKLNFMIMKLNSMRQKTIHLEMPQQYAELLIERMTGSHHRKTPS